MRGYYVPLSCVLAAHTHTHTHTLGGGRDGAYTTVEARVRGPYTGWGERDTSVSRGNRSDTPRQREENGGGVYTIPRDRNDSCQHL